MLDLKVINKKVSISSKAVSERFDKKHGHVMEAIRNLECSDRFRESNFRSSAYTSLQNKELPCYEISRDGFAFLAMGFVGIKAAEWKEKYIVAFNTMETSLLRGIKSDSITDINSMLKGIEDLNQIGSIHGKGLADYAKKKKDRVIEYQTAIDSVQMVLNIK